jgi:hypothetical protein
VKSIDVRGREVECCEGRDMKMIRGERSLVCKRTLHGASDSGWGNDCGVGVFADCVRLCRSANRFGGMEAKHHLDEQDLSNGGN